MNQNQQKLTKLEEEKQEYEQNYEQIQQELYNEKTNQKSYEDFNFYNSFQLERNNYIQLTKLFQQNVLQPEFQRSKQAALTLIFLPALVNSYYVFIRPYSVLKNIMRVGSILGCFANLQMSLNRDFKQIVEQDSKLGNQARKYLQNISYNDMSIPSFENETDKILEKRKGPN